MKQNGPPIPFLHVQECLPRDKFDVCTCRSVSREKYLMSARAGVPPERNIWSLRMQKCYPREIFSVCACRSATRSKNLASACAGMLSEEKIWRLHMQECILRSKFSSLHEERIFEVTTCGFTNAKMKMQVLWMKKLLEITCSKFI